MTDTQETLKPCPFCGATEQFQGAGGDGWVHHISCSACELDFSAGKNLEECRTAWNRRATPEAETHGVRVKALADARDRWNRDQDRPAFDALSAAIDAALEPAPVQGWQPIKTAPRVELEDIIVFNGVLVQAAQWWEGGWVDSACEWITVQPTHWMPLPPAPQEDA